jgi:hypothetical protein
MKRVALLSLLATVACAPVENPQREQTEKLFVEVSLPSGDPLPGPGDAPLPLPLAAEVDLDFNVVARRSDGSLDEAFEGFVRISAIPGSVVSVTGDRAQGRNVFLSQGQALGQHVRVRNPRGSTRIWAEDIGYVPGDPAGPPLCSDGLDNDDDGPVDYPNDPGCAFANDNTEGPGSYAAGVSSPIRFQRPRLGDVQGRGATTPYDQEGVDVATEPDPGVDCGTDPDQCPEIIVTRIAADGFYATDINDPGGFNHIFAFTFSAPGGLRVCDRITQLSGTAVEFFGFTEMSFPSFELSPWLGKPGDGTCPVPVPITLDANTVEDDAVMEIIESALVRVADVRIGQVFGPDSPAIVSQGPSCAEKQVQFDNNASNCDLDGNGDIDFETLGSDEACCANACGTEPECVEWSAFAARGNYRVLLAGNRSLQISTGTIPRSQLDPLAMRGKTLQFVTGTLRNFSGGALNWTVEARCAEDVVCDDPGQTHCVEGPSAPIGPDSACVFERSIKDPNEATN